MLEKGGDWHVYCNTHREAQLLHLYYTNWEDKKYYVVMQQAPGKDAHWAVADVIMGTACPLVGSDTTNAMIIFNPARVTEMQQAQIREHLGFPVGMNCATL
jgi:hypothetical protein